MKGVVVFLVSLVFACEAMADDTFQIIPYGSGRMGGAPVPTFLYWALVINEATGQMYNCQVPMRTGQLAPAPNLVCAKATGTRPPPGPALLSDSEVNNANVIGTFMAIWKIDQRTGDVTFCGSGGTRTHGNAVDWSCVTVPLP
jgi:hypothetical protein